MNNNYNGGHSYDINLNALTRSGGRGNRESSLHNIFKNKNWLGGLPQVPVLNENQGLVFVTKPDMCLHPSNIGHIRELSYLTSPDPHSLGGAMRDMLDPRGAWENRTSWLNDPLYPFLGIVDNTIITMDGFPDYVMDEFISNPGKAGSTYIHAKGRIKRGQHYPLTITHRNLPGDVLNNYYTANSLYQEFVHRWVTSPHNVNVRHHRLDYTSRIYRFALDSTGTRVNQFTMSGYGYPKAGSQGAVMSVNNEEGINSGYDTISASWSNVGVYHNDPIVIRCFNMSVARFNPAMADGVREKMYVRVGAKENSASLIHIAPFQYFGYPRINPRTLEFEVWVDKGLYNHLTVTGISDSVLDTIRHNVDNELGAAIQSRGINYARSILTR